MHPHHLHALTAAHALREALGTLHARATAERAERVREQLPAADISSPRWGGPRTGSGTHGDPTSLTVVFVESIAAGPTWWADLADRADQRILWIACQISPTRSVSGDPLTRIIRRIPHLSPDTAGALHRHLVDEHRWIAEAVGVAERLTTWPGDCPACGQRLLQLHTAAPRPEWTVTCSARDCVCAGDSCPCRMPVRVRGVTHIWLRSTLVAPAVVPSAA